MLPAILRRPASRRFKLLVVGALVVASSLLTWKFFHAADIDLDINTGTARRPLVVVGGKVEQMPSGDYLAANTLVDATGCSSTNVIAWNGTQFACAAASGGITNGAGANVVMKSDGTNAVTSSLTDDGTTFAVNSSKFTVTESSGNTFISGTTHGSGAATFDSTVFISGTSHGSGAATFDSTMFISGTTHGSGAATFDSTGSFGGAVNMNSHLINNVTDPVSAQDAATRAYVLAHAGSADYGSGMGSGTITVSTATTGSTVNLSTLGTIDWLSVVSAGGAFQTRTSMLCNANSTGCFEKLTGGSLLAVPGVDFVGPSGGSPFTGNGAVTFSSTASDSVMGAALSSLSVSGWPTVLGGGGSPGGGIRFMLPSPGGNIQRVARIYLYQVGDTVVCTAHALDGSAPDATGTSNVASGTALQTTYTVTYTTNTAGFVEVLCQETVANGGTPNVAWGAVSLGFT